MQEISQMRLGLSGIELIQRYESLKLKVYRAPEGKWTIGWGHTRTAREGMVITREQAQELFRADVRVAEDAIKRVAPHTRLPQLCYDALVSWEFNCGAIGQSTNTIRRFLREGRLDEIDEQLLRWKYFTNPRTGQKEVARGLVRRRTEEAEMWNAGLASIITPEAPVEPAVPEPYVPMVQTPENPPTPDEKQSTKVAAGTGAAGVLAGGAMLVEEADPDILGHATTTLGGLAAHSQYIAFIFVVLSLVGIYVMWRKTRRK